MPKTMTRIAVLPFALATMAGCSFTGSASDPDAAAGTSTPSPTADSSSAGSASPSGPATSSATAPVSNAGTPSAGGDAQPGPAAGSTEGAPASSGGPDRCHTSELTGLLVPGDPGAGQRHATLVLKNTGGETCTVFGYGGVGLVDAAGKPLPTDQVRAPSPAPALVTLRPGSSVGSQLHWGVVPGDGDAQTGDCQPVPAALRVIPPDETDALSVRWQSGPVCQGGRIEQQAYTAG